MRGDIGAPAAATTAVGRKRANAPVQRSIAAAFQAAKCSNSNSSDAGKLKHAPHAAADVVSKSDQLEDFKSMTLRQHGTADADQHLVDPQPSSPAAAANKQQQQQQGMAACVAAAAAEEHASKKRQHPKSTTSGKRNAASKQPRLTNRVNVTATAEPKGDNSEVELLESGHDEAAAAGVTGAAADATFTKEEVVVVSGSLLAWYDKVQRVLPWRRNPHHKPDKLAAAAATEPSLAAAAADAGSGSGNQKKLNAKQLATAAAAGAILSAAQPAPADLSPQQFAYYVWVSEIMLQQTQVSRVVTYFNKWIASWPTVAALAAATQEQVNEVWAGLGYYRRARYLLEGAKFIMNKLDGKFPETAAKLRLIPGVGPYTAAAVASIAFNDPAAAVDGNVIRVCARLRAVKGNPSKLMRVWDKLAAQLLHPDRPGCHNQAMMELGATVCKPVNPSCPICPVNSCCAAYKLATAAGDVEDAPKVTDYPEKVVKAAKAEQQVAVCVLKVLLLPDAATAASEDCNKTAAAAGGAAVGTKGSKKGAAGAAGVAASKATSIRSFFKPTAKQQQQKQDDGAAAWDSASKQCESDLLAAGATAHYLLVQRPENGLLAGLWEFPGTVIDCAPTPTARRAAIDSYMAGTLDISFPATASSSSGGGGSGSKHARSAAAPPAAAAAAAARVCVIHRRQLGSVVHIFSHIRQTLHAEELVLLAPSLDSVCSAAVATSSDQAAAAVKGQPAAAGKASAPPEEDSDDEADETAQQQTGRKRARTTGSQAAATGGPPAMRWVAASDIVQAGLTSGVRKVFNLCMK